MHGDKRNTANAKQLLSGLFGSLFFVCSGCTALFLRCSGCTRSILRQLVRRAKGLPQQWHKLWRHTHTHTTATLTASRKTHGCGISLQSAAESWSVPSVLSLSRHRPLAAAIINWNASGVFKMISCLCSRVTAYTQPQHWQPAEKHTGVVCKPSACSRVMERPTRAVYFREPLLGYSPYTASFQCQVCAILICYTGDIQAMTSFGHSEPWLHFVDLCLIAVAISSSLTCHYTSTSSRLLLFASRTNYRLNPISLQCC